MRITILTLIALMTACTQRAPQQNEAATNAAAITNIVTPTNNVAAEEPLNPPAPGEPGGLPDDRTPISEGPIDPKSARGAGQVAQTYFALLESGKRAEASKLWSDKAQEPNYSAFKEVHANIGSPGEPEAAAGSIFVDIPIQLYGRRQNGTQFSTLGEVTLRRVNDVPGSTPEQREWRLYRTDLLK
jgi:hypothetical protein